MVICTTKFCKSDVILAGTTSSNTFSSNSSMRSITFSLWASTAVTSSWRTHSALTGPVACDNGSELSHPIPHVSLGLTALAGAASAGVFLDLNASLGLRCGQGFVSSAANPSHACPGTQISTSPWARRDLSSASLTRVQEIHTSKRTSGPVPALPGACSQPTISFIFIFSFRIFIILSTWRQQCFSGELAGNTNSTTQSSSAPDTTAIRLLRPARSMSLRLDGVCPSSTSSPAWLTSLRFATLCRVPNLATPGNDDTIVEALEAGHGERRCESCPLGTATRFPTTHFWLSTRNHFLMALHRSHWVIMNHIYT